ncbi:unnamed protein product [Lymnaea stagnalis]|uniref:MICOS complex subunit MIC13 n=1 Tax=Lymnaea stagnalis TaxID=6523 RepID=A0AAV2HWV8_LYMST
MVRTSLTVFKNATKVSLVGGLFYWSVGQGIWGTSDQGAEAGKRLAKAIAPSIVEYRDKEYSDLFQPLGELRSEERGEDTFRDPLTKNEIRDLPPINSSFTKSWNTTMELIFTSIANIPETTVYYSNQLKKKLLNSSSEEKKV